MKKLTLALCLLPVLAHARYEDLSGAEGPAPLADINLALYIFGALAAWCALVWDGGWRLRWVPLALGAACVVAAVGWGNAGLGVVAVCAPVAAWVAAVCGAFNPR